MRILPAYLLVIVAVALVAPFILLLPDGLRQLAIALNNRGVRTAQGGKWQVSNVRNMLARVGTGL